MEKLVGILQRSHPWLRLLPPAKFLVAIASSEGRGWLYLHQWTLSIKDIWLANSINSFGYKAKLLQNADLYWSCFWKIWTEVVVQKVVCSSQEITILSIKYERERERDQYPICKLGSESLWLACGVCTLSWLSRATVLGFPGSWIASVRWPCSSSWKIVIGVRK